LVLALQQVLIVTVIVLLVFAAVAVVDLYSLSLRAWSSSLMRKLNTFLVPQCVCYSKAALSPGCRLLLP